MQGRTATQKTLLNFDEGGWDKRLLQPRDAVLIYGASDAHAPSLSSSVLPLRLKPNGWPPRRWRRAAPGLLPLGTMMLDGGVALTGWGLRMGRGLSHPLITQSLAGLTGRQVVVVSLVRGPSGLGAPAER